MPSTEDRKSTIPKASLANWEFTSDRIALAIAEAQKRVLGFSDPFTDKLVASGSSEAVIAICDHLLREAADPNPTTWRRLDPVLSHSDTENWQRIPSLIRKFRHHCNDEQRRQVATLLISLFNDNLRNEDDDKVNFVQQCLNSCDAPDFFLEQMRLTFGIELPVGHNRFAMSA